jgi:glutaconyl-CoA/methylmalonyl-CoA decarboxylase subunit gamma
MIKKLRVTVDGKPYDVTVELPDESDAPVAAAPTAAVPAPAPASPPAPSPPQAAPPIQAAPGIGMVLSPLAGRVTAIVAKPGQEVRENDHLLTLEAMKMNTFVFAPRPGKVAEIMVAVGDAVLEEQKLARIE